MTAKQYLQQLYRMDNRINAKHEQCDQLRKLALQISASKLGERVSGGGFVADRMAESVARIVDLERDIIADITRMVELRREISAVIDSVPNEDYRLLLTLRYLNFKTWEQIAVEMNYSWRNVMRLHNKSLQYIKLS